MKIYKKILTIISSAVVLAVGNPAFAQNETAPSQPGVSQNELAPDPSLATPQPDTAESMPTQQQPYEPDTGIAIDEPAGASNDATNWSWLGLLGLAGLFGLKRHHEEKTGEYRTSRA